MKKIFTDFKCFVTALITAILVVLILVPIFRGEKPDDAIIAVFCTEIGAVFTYYFTKKKDGE